MDMQRQLAADLAVDFQTLEISKKRHGKKQESKAFVRSVGEKQWKQQVSSHSSRHLLNVDIVPESNLWNKNYPSFLATTRLNTLKLFLHPASKSALKMDAVLCVAGNDGNNNGGSTQLLSYLLQGKTAHELDSKDIDNTGVSEVVFVADVNSVSVWTPSKNQFLGDQSQPITELVANWSNCELWQHVLSESSRDQYEMAKINYFVDYFRSPDSRSTINDFANKSKSAVIGVPYAVDEDAMSIDKWPLVQAFALGDGVGAGTFFTLQHNVHNCSHIVEELECNVDAQTLRVDLLSNIPRLIKHWGDSLHLLSGTRKALNRAQLCELDVAEALKTFFDFGRLGQRANRADTIDGNSAPLFEGGRVLFGARTSKAGAKSTDAQSSEEFTIGPVDGQHLTFEGGDALSGIRAARTYFLSAGDTHATPAAQAAPRLYEELVECHHACMEQLGGLLSKHMQNRIAGRPGALSLDRLETALAQHVATELKERAETVFDEDTTAALTFFNQASTTPGFVQVHVHAFDAKGASPKRSTVLADVVRHNFYIEIKLWLGNEIGSLLVGDSIPALSLAGESAPDLASWPSTPLVLTTDIPYFCTWQGRSHEISQTDRVLSSLDSAVFTSDDDIHFDAVTAEQACPGCTGCGIGEATGTILRDCLVLVNNGNDEDDDDDSGEEEEEDDEGGLAIPHQCQLYGDIRIHTNGFVLKVIGATPIVISFFEAEGSEAIADVACAAIVDACPAELQLMLLSLTERARSIVFAEDRMFFSRQATALAVVLPVGSDVQRTMTDRFGSFCRRIADPRPTTLASFDYALDRLAPFRIARMVPYLNAAAEQDRLLVNTKLHQLTDGSVPQLKASTDSYAPGNEPEVAILVTGAGQSGKAALGYTVARELHRTGVNRDTDCVFDQSLLENCRGADRVDCLDLQALQKWLIERRRQRVESVQKRKAGVVVIIAPDVVSAPAAVAQLKKLGGHGVAIQFTLHVINVASYTVEAAATAETSEDRCPPATGSLPGVFSSLVPGFVSSVVLTNCTLQIPSDALIYLTKLVETCTNGANVVRASGGVGGTPLRLHFALADILPSSMGGNFEQRNGIWEQRLSAQVAVVAAGDGRAQTWTGSLCGRLGRTAVVVSASSSKEHKWVKFSARALRSFFVRTFRRGAGGSRRFGDLFCVTGKAFLKHPAGTASKPVCVSFWASAPRFWVCNDPNRAIFGQEALVWDRAELVVTGGSVHVENFEQAFVTSIFENGEMQHMKQVLSVATLTDEQKAEIKKIHLSDSLPQGYYFDGANYFNPSRRVCTVLKFGKRGDLACHGTLLPCKIQKYHPNMDQFMEKYVQDTLAAENASNEGGSTPKSKHASGVEPDTPVLEEED